MVTVYIPTAFRPFSKDRESVDIELPGGGSLRKVIELLEAECPGIKEPLMFEGGVHPSIAVFINDEQTVDYHDDVDAKGFIGLQHHGEKGQTYRFRNIRIKEIKAEAAEEKAE